MEYTPKLESKEVAILREIANLPAAIYEEFKLVMGRPVRPRGKVDKRKQHQEVKKPKVVDKTKNTVEASNYGLCRCGRPATGAHGICDFHLMNETQHNEPILLVLKGGTCPRCGHPLDGSRCSTCKKYDL